MWRLYPILVEAELESQHSNWSTVCIYYIVYTYNFLRYISFEGVKTCCTCDITASEVQSRLSVCLAKHPLLSLV